MGVAEGVHQRGFQVPAGATEVILVRHGASAPAYPDEPFPLVNGQSDPELAPEGERQAEQLVERLATEPLTGLFVTPLTRTQQTVAPLAKRLGVAVRQAFELPGAFDHALRRLDVLRDPLVARVFAEERWDVIPTAEPAEEFARRVRAGLDKVTEAVGPDGVAAAVCHGGVIAELCHQVTRSRPFAFVTVDNASLTRLVMLASGTWILRTFNDTAHLD